MADTIETEWEQVGDLKVKYFTRDGRYVPCIVRPGEDEQEQLTKAKERLDELIKTGEPPEQFGQ